MVFIVQKQDDYDSYAEVLGVFLYYETALLEASVASKKSPLCKYEVKKYELNTDDYSAYIKPDANLTKLLDENDILDCKYLNTMKKYIEDIDNKARTEKEDNLKLVETDIKELVNEYKNNVQDLERKLKTSYYYEDSFDIFKKIDLENHKLRNRLVEICKQKHINMYSGSSKYILDYVEDLKDSKLVPST